MEKNLTYFNLLLIIIGIGMVLIANAWQDEDTSLDIILAALGGFFIGGALILNRK